MRLLLLLIALFGAFVLVAMVVAPTQPALRSWYLNNACEHLDRLSTDICAAVRREAGKSGRAVSSESALSHHARIGHFALQLVSPK